MTGPSTLQWLGIGSLALRLLAGGAITAADIAMLEAVGKSLLTPENEAAVLDFIKAHSGQVKAVLIEGAIWIVHQNANEPAAVADAVLVDSNGTPIAGVGPLPEDWPSGG